MASESPVVRHPSGWRSYDSVAEAYADVVTLRNAVMARDLIALVAPVRYPGVPRPDRALGLVAQLAASTR